MYDTFRYIIFPINSDMVLVSSSSTKGTDKDGNDGKDGDDGEDGGSNTGLIVGVVLGILAVVILIAVVVWCINKRQKTHTFRSVEHVPMKQQGS